MKRTRNLATATLAIAFTGLLVSLSTASPANAAVSDCRAGAFCLWDDQNFSGGMAVPSSFGDGAPDLGRDINGNLTFNDLATSGRNNTGTAWCIYDDLLYGGERLAYFAPNTQISRLPTNTNDRASSARACPRENPSSE